jgi:hypothetical protein
MDESEVREKLRNLLKHYGVRATARVLRMNKVTMLSVAAGAPVSQSSIEQARDKMVESGLVVEVKS